MANITIPNLPQVSAATSLDYLVITNSGETTTSKITKADLLSGIGGGNLVEGGGTDTYTTTGNEAQVSGTNNILLTANRAFSNSGTIGGSQNTILANGGNIGNGSITGNANLWGGGAFFENSSRSVSASRASVLSSQYVKDISGTNVFIAASSRPVNGASTSAIIASFNPTIGSGSNSFIGGGDGSQIPGLGSASVVMGGQDNIAGGGFANNVRANGVFVGRLNETAGSATCAATMAGQGNVNSTNFGVIAGGRSNATTGGADDVILGGFSHSMNNANQSAILAGYDNTMNGGTASIMAGAYQCNSNGYISGIYNSLSSINDAPISAMIACDDTDIVQGRFSFAAGDRDTFVFNDYEMNDTTHLLSMGNDTTSIYLNSSAGNSGATMMIGSTNSWIGATSTTTADIKRSAIIGSYNSHISSSGGTHVNNFIIGSKDTDIDNRNGVIAIGVDGYTANTDNVVVVPQLVMTEYASLNFTDDLAAAAGGVVLGGIYHNAGALRVRIS